MVPVPSQFSLQRAHVDGTQNPSDHSHHSIQSGLQTEKRKQSATQGSGGTGQGDLHRLGEATRAKERINATHEQGIKRHLMCSWASPDEVRIAVLMEIKNGQRYADHFVLLMVVEQSHSPGHEQAEDKCEEKDANGQCNCDAFAVVHRRNMPPKSQEVYTSPKENIGQSGVRHGGQWHNWHDASLVFRNEEPTRFNHTLSAVDCTSQVDHCCWHFPAPDFIAGFLPIRLCWRLSPGK